MKTLVFLGVVLCLVAVQARHIENSEIEGQENNEGVENPEPIRDNRASQNRHRRKRWQMNYGYNYPPPPNPFYADRRDYDRNQELIPQILRLLDEIAVYVRQPSAPVLPQPIYVPYPVPYPIPQNCKCDGQVAVDPNVTNRFPEMEDTNQNWGLIDLNQQVPEDDGNDGARPISFDTIKPIRPMRRPSPKVEHGSVQASNNPPKQLRTPTIMASTNSCDAAILSCCNDQQRECFTRFDCPTGYARRNVICTRASVEMALQAFRNKYSPV